MWEAEGVTCTYSGPEGESMIAFPILSEEHAGPVLNEIVAFYLRHGPKKLVGCWSLDPPQPLDLGARLLARGFQPGWKPCWMALDLHAVRTDHPRPAGLSVYADSAAASVKGLPYSGPNGAITAERFPDRMRRYAAALDGKVVGHSAVVLTEGPYGIAGIYDVGVAEEARNQGIGKAVTLASCLYARERGYRYALLNATGRRMYEQIGFQWIGDGSTWWLNVPRLAANPPTANLIALAEAIGRGDVDALDSMRARFSAEDMRAPMTNEMTLMELAVDSRQPASADWLTAQGVPLTALVAWDFGWKDRAARILTDDPDHVNHRFGEWKITLLHEAAYRNDVELARLALSARPDLDAKDTEYRSTPLGWAKHLDRPEIARLIEEQSGL